MKKIPSKVLTFFSEEWTKENRKLILKSFKISIDLKKINYANNFYLEKGFEKKIKVYDRKNKLFIEFSKIPIGSKTWYNDLNFECKYYLKGYCDKLLKEKNFQPMGFLSEGQVKFISNQMQKLKQLFVSDESYHCFLRQDMELRESAIKSFVWNRKPLFSPILLLEKVKIYAIKNKLSYFDEEGNLLPKIIKDYLNGAKALPMSEYEKIKLSTRRTKEKFVDLARCNIDSFESFVTLTFADKSQEKKYIKNNLQAVDMGECDLKFTYVENSQDYDLCIKKLNTFLSRLRTECKKQDVDFKYLGVPEYQKNGNIHYHFLFSNIPNSFLYDIPSWLDYDYKTQERRFDVGIIKWVYGKSTLEPIEDKKRIIEYISKYLLKSLEEIRDTEYLERFNKRRYYASTNLVKPIIEYDIGFDMQSEYEDNRDSVDTEVEEEKEDKLIYRKTNSNFYNQSVTQLYEVNQL